MATFSFKHPELGEIRTHDYDGVLELLGLKYASLEDRFAPAELVEATSGESLDATKYGPQVLSPLQGIDIERGLIQQALPNPEFPGVSDSNGLNLNITSPTGGSKLPVVVFIHGGAFGIGANWYPHYDFKRLVRMSIEQGMPIIGITINYRLGAPGFLFSEEMREAGYLPNNGLRDQRVALQWIKRFIAGFGGDPDNLTVMGHSAGGISTSYMLGSDEPLCKQLIIFGGSPPLLKPFPLEIAEHLYQQVTNALGLGSLSAPDRVKALKQTDGAKLLEVTPMSVPLVPVVDDDIVKSVPNFEAVATKGSAGACGAERQWCQALIVGDSADDASAFVMIHLMGRKAGIGSAFVAHVRNSLSSQSSTAEALLRSYGLDGDVSDDDAAIRKLIKLGSDLNFFAPAVHFAAAFKGKSYVFHFNELNPWDGPMKGLATHILDVAFLFQNFNERLSEEQRSTAVQLGKDIISFVNGEAPWPPYNTENGAGVYAHGKREYVTAAGSTGREDTVFQLAEKAGLDQLLDVWQAFLFGV
ncbi:alpha/beta-hydrolase [Rhizodiscina lignyota]|uniref:Carboxylic ester hydrolase n=1 Tax=Rhizodiscina lignyota TaxID=1504668 RepID=A0A9P4I9C4_9PEZI|nr:alpha/beta-hydrolase [Rhizodiscina lignyota]